MKGSQIEGETKSPLGWESQRRYGNQRWSLTYHDVGGRFSRGFIATDGLQSLRPIAMTPQTITPIDITPYRSFFTL